MVFSYVHKMSFEVIPRDDIHEINSQCITSCDFSPFSEAQTQMTDSNLATRYFFKTALLWASYSNPRLYEKSYEVKELEKTMTLVTKSMIIVKV